MTKIVRQRDGLGEVLVQAERPCQRPRDARDLNGVRHPRPVMIAGAVEENLRLVFEPAKRAAVDDPVPVALEIEPETVLVLGMQTPARRGTILRVRREVTDLTSLQIKTASRHYTNLSSCGLRFN